MVLENWVLNNWELRFFWQNNYHRYWHPRVSHCRGRRRCHKFASAVPSRETSLVKDPAITVRVVDRCQSSRTCEPSPPNFFASSRCTDFRDVNTVQTADKPSLRARTRVCALPFPLSFVLETSSPLVWALCSIHHLHTKTPTYTSRCIQSNRRESERERIKRFTATMASMFVSSPRPWTARCRMVNGSSFMQGIAERHAVSRCAMAPRIGPSFGARFVSLHQRRYIAFESELHGRRSVATGASRRGKSPSLSEADLYAAEAASAAQPSGSSSAGMPWYGSLSIGLGAVLIVLRGVKAVARRRNSSLEERGFKRGGVADEAYYDSE